MIKTLEAIDRQAVTHARRVVSPELASFEIYHNPNYVRNTSIASLQLVTRWPIVTIWQIFASFSSNPPGKQY
uniref:Uncharacterized protein n=1 Tax=Setaria italica TaxID=4555 RepID=K3YKM0_SETIT